MPRISYFYGISIYMHYNEHGPPHFHAHYGELDAVINIRTKEVIRGRLPRRESRLVRQWAIAHELELLEDWDRRPTGRALKEIEPLE
jgi:hypothetical protein